MRGGHFPPPSVTPSFRGFHQQLTVTRFRTGNPGRRNEGSDKTSCSVGVRHYTMPPSSSAYHCRAGRRTRTFRPEKAHKSIKAGIRTQFPHACDPGWSGFWLQDHGILQSEECLTPLPGEHHRWIWLSPRKGGFQAGLTRNGSNA